MSTAFWLLAAQGLLGGIDNIVRGQAEVQPTGRLPCPVGLHALRDSRGKGNDVVAYFAFNLAPPVPVGQSRIASYREVLANWKQDFDAFHRFGLCFVLRLHPEITGTAGRIGILRDLLAAMRERGDVW